MSRRGQASTEYLVVLGAVLLVAAVTLFMVASSTDTVSEQEISQSQLYWKSMSTLSIASSKAVDDMIVLGMHNSAGEPLWVTSLSFGGAQADLFPYYSGDTYGDSYCVNNSGVLTCDVAIADGATVYVATSGGACGSNSVYKLSNLTIAYRNLDLSGLLVTGESVLYVSCTPGAGLVVASPSETPSGTPSATPTPSPSPTPSPTPNAAEFDFFVVDGSGSNVAAFSYTGGLVLKGGCTAGAAGSCSSSEGALFAVRDGTGVSHASINGSGSLCIEDANCNGYDALCATPAEGSFAIRNPEGTVVSYISPAGALCATGGVWQYGTP